MTEKNSVGTVPYIIRNWLRPSMANSGVCKQCAAELAEKRQSLGEYFRSCLKDPRVSDDTKKMIRDWVSKNIDLLDAPGGTEPRLVLARSNAGSGR